MAKKVLRYTVEVKNGVQQVHLPDKCKIVYVDSKTLRFLDMWVECAADEIETNVRNFEVFGTGHVIPHDTEYIGSAMNRSEDHEGLMATAVWHLYEHVI